MTGNRITVCSGNEFRGGKGMIFKKMFLVQLYSVIIHLHEITFMKHLSPKLKKGKSCLPSFCVSFQHMKLE